MAKTITVHEKSEPTAEPASDVQDQIRRRAYELYERRGAEEGHGRVERNRRTDRGNVPGYEIWKRGTWRAMQFHELPERATTLSCPVSSHL